MRVPPLKCLAAAAAVTVLTASSPAPQALGPAVVLISLDGFRDDYFERFPTPHLHRLAARGVRARWMVPVFPSNTFPSHYSMATGLVPARHGIVDNHFIDPSDGARFRYSDTATSRRSRWWQGEPVWVTAERQGLRAAAYFWPGTDVEIGGVRPSRWKPFDVRVPNADRVDSVLAWLQLPPADRPRFVTLYFSDVDHWGHETGPDSPELAAAVGRVDSMLGRLVGGLERARLAGAVSLVIVSDHGMAPLSAERVLVLDAYLDRGRVTALSLGATISLRPAPRDGMPADSIAAALAAVPHLFVYPREGTPARWRYRDNPRISDVVGVAEAGWTVTTRAAVAAGRVPRAGAHGFDNADPTMRALFVAAGPAFRRGVVVEPFTNLHVYELLCRILGLRPAPNDGSLDSVRAMLR